MYLKGTFLWTPCKSCLLVCECMIGAGDQCVNPGAELSLDCDPGGQCVDHCSWDTPVGECSWSRDKGLQCEDSSISVLDTSSGQCSLLVSDPQSRHSGVWRCKVTPSINSFIGEQISQDSNQKYCCVRSCECECLWFVSRIAASGLVCQRMESRTAVVRGGGPRPHHHCHHHHHHSLLLSCCVSVLSLVRQEISRYSGKDEASVISE